MLGGRPARASRPSEGAAAWLDRRPGVGTRPAAQAPRRCSWPQASHLLGLGLQNRRNPIEVPPGLPPAGTLERWPSGLRRTPGTRVYVKAYRGFESHSLRQTLVAWGRTKSQFPLRTQRSSASLVLGGRIKAHAMLYMDCASSSAYLYIEGSNYADGCAIGILPQRSPRPLPLRLAHGRTLLAVPLSVAGTRADPRPRRISDTLARPCAAADQLADPGTGFGSNLPWILTEVFAP